LNGNLSVGELTVQELIARARSLELSGLTDQGINLYSEWLLKYHNSPLAYIAWYEFGRLLFSARLFLRAENAFKAGLEINPQLHEATLALGLALEAQGRIPEALALWGGSLQPLETRISVLNNLGRIFDSEHRVEECEKVLLESLHLKTNQTDVISTLLHLRRRLCRWPVFSSELGLGDLKKKEYFGPLSSLAEYDDPQANLDSVKIFLKLKGWDKAQPSLVPRGARYPNHPKIKVGFFSADFKLHATSIFFASLLELLSRDEFEVYALDITVAKEFSGSNMQARLLKAVDHHIPLQSLSDAAAAAAIRAQEIDILVDMSGLTAGGRPQILNYRPAPMQVSYLGFIGSTAIEAIDYIMTVQDLLPSKFESCFTEKPLYLPGPYFAIDKSTQMNVSFTREDCGLPSEGFVYCALLNSYKITPTVFDCWLRILKAVDKSVLWLVEENLTTRQNLVEYARAHGVDESKLVFSKRMHPEQYRASLAVADLFLDTSPYGNGATTHDAILANLPVLTCPGNTMMSRLSSHMMKQAGWGQFSVNTWDEYERQAIYFGHYPENLAKQKQQMRASFGTGKLFDAHIFAHDFGETLKKGHQLMDAN